MATGLIKFRKEYSQSPKQSETDYVWRVCLTWGDKNSVIRKRDRMVLGAENDPDLLSKEQLFGLVDSTSWRNPLATVGNINQIVERMKKLLV